MFDTSAERNSYSNSNLIEVRHVGVTAKMQSPLKSLRMSYSSSTDSENNQILYRCPQNSNTKYNKFLNEANNGSETTITENSKILYEKKSVSKELKRKSCKKLTTRSKIEFQLYGKPKKRLQNCGVRKTKQTKNAKSQLFENEVQNKANILDNKESKNSKKTQQPTIDNIFADLPAPELFNQNYSSNKEVRIGIYPFEHGSAEYLKIHDCPPQTLSLVLAERATYYATRFWAEFFGSLQIAVAFIVTFLLQSYRFVLYTIINILLVEFLHMTSDYLIKPLLTVIFNGFLQPPLIFCFNILSTLRDILEPIADMLNNFMKPVATVGRSIRLIHATYNKKNLAKNV